MKIFVTRDIPDEGIKMLRKRRGVEVSIYPEDQPIPRKELLNRVKGVEILLPLLTDKIDDEVMAAAGPRLHMIANYAVGFDNIDLEAAKKRKIVVTNAANPEISETVAEHAIALIFALAHRIVETDAFARKGKYKGWGPKTFLGVDVSGKTLGIIGGGAIGSALAKKMRNGFGVSIVYHDVKRNEQLEHDVDAKFLSKDALLKTADFVSLHVPLLPATHHLLSKKEFKRMKKTAFVINTARGPVIDEKALVSALKRGQIAGAGLDVYEHEPKIDSELRKLPNVVLTPHTASASIEARQAMSRAAAQNILDFLDGKTPKNAVK